MLAGAMLANLEESGEAILTLVEGVEEEAFFKSRLTRQEVHRYLVTMSETAERLPPEVRQEISEVDWGGWIALGKALKGDRQEDRDAFWYGVRSLTPATLLWLRVYRQSHPDLFSLTP